MFRSRTHQYVKVQNNRQIGTVNEFSKIYEHYGSYPSKELSANGFSSMKSACMDLAVWPSPAATVSSFPR